MKKIWVLPLTALFLFGCILAAGCVSQTTPVETADVPVQTVTFEKNGTTYNIGESFQVILPSNPSTGYDWYITESDGLNITKSFIPAENAVTGAAGHTVITITSLKQGTYKYTFEYKREWETDEPPLYVYKCVRTCVPSSEPALTTPRGTVGIDGSVNPAIGEIVKITTTVSPTAGYTWSLAGGSNLEVISSEYTASADGSAGTYVWLVTSKTAGSYLIRAVEQRPGELDALTTCNVGITFIDKEANHASGFGFR